ncbi:MAG: chitobiase/beta-hexosaminidase C-terminal domain-containing protein [Bacteroidaceae bacterium]|nr:chitobiase/beta-hexosaminidase C-terminal domain-containing protein [Bacteroidaceae bacterium]
MKKFLLSILCLVAVALTGYAADATFDFAAHYGATTISGIDAKDPMTVDGVTMTFAKGNSQTAPAYNKSGEIRLYGGKSADVLDGNTVTVTAPAGSVITSVVFNPGSNGTWGVLLADNGNVSTADDHTATWSGNAETVVFTASRNADNTGASTQNRYATAVVTYSTLAASSVATPTFSVAPDTYGEKISVELECETDGATIYYTLDGNTPDNTSTLYEAAIELNSKTTVKAIAYVGEEASNVATATYDFKLEGSLSFVTAPIFASDMQGKIEWTADWANNTVNYLVTYDGTVPTVDNKANTGTGKTRNIPMYSWKKDTAVVVSIRPEKDGIYGDTFKKTYYIKYAKTLDAYKTVSEVAAGNYVLVGENSVMLPIDGEGKDYGYGYTVDATVNNGLVSAFGLFEFAFEAADGGYYIKDSKGQYLYAKGTYKSFNLSSTVPATGGVWSVEIQANGQAKISNNETGRWIQWDDYYKNWAMPDGDQGTFMPTLAAKHVPTLEMTPAANATVETLDKIVLTCSDGIASGSGMKYVSIQGKDVTATVTANQVDDNTLELVLSEPITAAGNYDFVFYKGCVTLGPGSLNQAYPAATQYITYTVGGGAEPIELVVTPANESVNKSLQHFTFSCEQGISINGLFGGQAPFLGFTDPTTGASSQIALTPGVSTETSVTLSTEAAQTTEGYYTLVVPAEYFVLAEAQPNEAIMYQYIVSATNPNAINIKSVTPEEGNVTELKQIIVMCDVEIDMAPSTWTITDAKGNVYPAQYTSPANLGFMGIQIDLKEAITAEGTYTLNIPAGSIVEYLGSKQIEEQTITWTIGGTVETPDYIFNAEDYEAGAEYPTLTDGIFTFLQGEESTKPWIFDANEKKFSNGHVATKRIKAQTDKNYLTADVPAAGKLVFGVLSSSSSATDRTLSVKQNDKELYGKIVSDATDKVDGVFTVHEVEVEAGLATITMVGSMNFYYIEFVPAGDAPATIEFLSVNPEEGVVTSLKNIQVITDTDLGEANDLTLTDADGKEYSLNAVTNDRVGEDGIYESIIITLSEEITAAGTYTLTIPAGKVVEYITDMETQTPKLNAEKTYTWTIEGEEELKIKSITLAEGAELESLSEIIVEFNKPVWKADKTATIKNTEDKTVVSLSAEMLEPVGEHKPIFGAAVPLATKVRLYASEAFTTAGEYYLNIPADMFATDDNSEYSTKTVVNFTIKENTPALSIVKTTPADGEVVDYIYEVQVEVSEPVYLDSFNGAQPYLLNGDGEKLATFGVDYPNYTGFHQGALGKFYLSKNLLFFLSSPIKDGGNYQIVIPANSFKTDDDSQSLPETIINVTIEGAEALAVVGSENTDKGITIKFNKEVQVVSGLYGGGQFVVYDQWGMNYGACMVSVNEDKTSIYAEFSETLAPESYRIVIPENTVKTTDGSETLASTSVSFTVSESAPAITATWSMQEGAVVESFESVDVTFAGEGIESAKAKNSYACIWFYEKDANGKYELVANDCTNGYMDATASGTTVTLSVDPGCYSKDFTSPFNRKGDYRIVIPAGGIKFNNDNNNLNTEEYVLNFTIENDYVAPEEVDAAYTATPENNSTIKELKEVVITFTEYDEIVVCEPDFAMGTNIPVVSMTDPDFGMTMPAGYMMARAGSAANELVLYVDPMYTGGMESYAVAGAYTVTIPAGVVKFGNNINKEFALNYTVEGVEQGLTVTASDPANGATVNKLESIVVDWNMGITVADASNLDATIQNVHGNVVSTLRAVFTGLAGNQIRYVLNTPVTENGIYTLVIPEGDVMDFDTETIFNAETTLTFTVDAPVMEAPAMVESDPANGATVDAIESITIVFNKPVVYDDYFEQASLQDKGGKVIANVKSADLKDGDEDNGATTIVFNLDSKVVEANTFIFVVPAKTIVDAYDWETMMEKDINIELTIGGSSVEDVIVIGSTPAENSIVKELSEITVEFNTGAAVLYMPNVVDESGKVLSTTTSSYYDADDNMLPDNLARFILTTPITNQGTVYLVIEAGSVYDYPNYAVPNSKEYRIKIEVTGSGINGIVADPVNGYVVYDLNGYRVMQTKKASDLERLNNGIYIINGVKVLLNK